MELQDELERENRILHVEDDLEDVELVRRQLARLRRPQYTIDNAQSLGDAVELLRSQPFDVVLLDLNLPDSSSLDAIQKVKAVWTDGPIIVMTGLDEECVGLDAIRHGAADYLTKDGLSASLLSRAICYAVERHRLTYWIKATGQSKDEYLIEVCNDLRETLSELLVATSVLVGNDETLDSLELQQIDKIMTCGNRMSKLIDEAKPTSNNMATAGGI